MGVENPDRQHSLTAEFDDGHIAYFSSPAIQHLFSKVLDPCLPREIQPYSFVTSDILRRALQELALKPRDLLVDLGCGTGGPGLWLAAQTSARLVGIDRSPFAIKLARSRATRFALRRPPVFVVANIASVPLSDQSVDAAACFDAIQFLDDPTPAYVEARRLLKTGGRIVVSTWLPADSADGRLQQRLRVYQPASMTEAGLRVINIQCDSRWDEAELRVAEAVCAMSDGEVASDEAARRVRAEAIETIRLRGATRRALITAVADGLDSSLGNGQE